MSSLINSLKNICSFKKVTASAQAIPYAWKASPLWFLLLTGILLLQGVVGPMMAVLAGYTVAILTHSVAMNPAVLVGLWVIVFVADTGLYPMMFLCTSQLNQRMNVMMREIIMNKGCSLQRLDFFDDEEFYDHIATIVDESKSRPANYVVLYTYILRGVVSIVSYAIILSQLSSWLPALVICSGLPITFALERMRKTNWVAQQKHRKELRFLEYLSNLSLQRDYAIEFRLFPMQHYVRTLFRDGVTQYNAMMQASRLGSLVRVIPGVLLGVVGYCVAMGYIIYGKQSAGMSVTAITACVESFIAMRATVDGIVQNMSFLGEKAYFFKDLNEFLRTDEHWLQDEKQHVSADSDVVRQPSSSPRTELSIIDNNQREYSDNNAGAPVDIEFQHVWFKYPHADKFALQDVSFKIYRGQTVAVCGRNGAGKSTLMQLLSGLYLPTRGRVLYDGVPMTAENVERIRASMAMLPQHYGVYAFDVEHNVSFHMQSTSRNNEHEHVCGAITDSGNGSVGFAEAASTTAFTHYGDADRNDVHEALQLAFGEDSIPPLSERLGREFGGVELSGGQAQRIAIARVLYRNASRVFLDEPTSAIDPLREAELFTVLSQVCADKTAVIVTHRLGLAMVSDYVLVLEQGRIAEQGTVEHLRTGDGLFADMVQHQDAVTIHEVSVEEQSGV